MRVAPDGPHHGRVLPRPGSTGRAAVHRQHLPLHAGRFGGLRAAGPHALRRGLPAHAGRPRSATLQERITSTDKRVHHLGAGRLRARRRPDRPRAGHHVYAPGRHHRPLPRDRGDWASTRRSTRWTPPAASSTRTSWARSTTAWRAGVQEVLQRYKELQRHHRHPGHGRALRGATASRDHRARRIQRFLSQPMFHVAEVFTGNPRQVREDGGYHPLVRARSSTASATISPSSASCTRAPSRTCTRPTRK